MQNISRQRDKHDSPIENAVRQHLSLHAEHPGDGTNKHRAKGGNDSTDHDDKIDHQGKIFLGILVPALAQSFGDNGAASRTNHKTNGADSSQVTNGQGQDERRTAALDPLRPAC